MAVGGHDETGEFAEVANLLWHARELLEQVLFRIVEEQLIISAGRIRWLTRANEELAAALSQLRNSEVVRAVDIYVLAGRLGLPPGATLTQLAEAAPEPWAGILDDHRAALRELTRDIDDEVAEIRHLLDIDKHSFEPGSVEQYVAEQAYREAGQLAATATQTSLIDFLS